MTKQLLKGNEAIAEAAVRAGVDAYFGYPITPQTELLEYMSRCMPELGRAFVQAESELAAINMVYGAACAGKRAMSSSSSPGVSLMQEGLSYIAAAQVPVVLVDVMRGGPGLGNIAPSQADYFQMVKSAGHGDFKPLVLAPASVQEAVGAAEIIHAAARGENITVVFINNAVYGMTGGQMAPTSLVSMKTTSSPFGRDVKTMGAPLHMSELIAQVTGATFVSRRSLHSPAEIRKANKAIRRAFEVQLNGQGFAMVELLSSCPTNWDMKPVEALRWIETRMAPVFPLGDLKNITPKNGLKGV